MSKHFVYLIQDGRMYFYTGSDQEGTRWSPDPAAAYSFASAWVPAEPTQEMPYRTERFVNLGEGFAQDNGASYEVGDTAGLLALHQSGPQIGQRVRVKETRSDGFAYGTGTVIGYASAIGACSLTHLVALDHPPAKGVPDEFGNICTDQEILDYQWCRIGSLEVI